MGKSFGVYLYFLNCRNLFGIAIVFDLLQNYYNLLKKAGITWKKTQKINPAKNEELVQAKKS